MTQCLLKVDPFLNLVVRNIACCGYMCYSLNSLKGIIEGRNIGFTKGDTRSLNNGLHEGTRTLSRFDEHHARSTKHVSRLRLSLNTGLRV